MCCSAVFNFFSATQFLGYNWLQWVCAWFAVTILSQFTICSQHAQQFSLSFPIVFKILTKTTTRDTHPFWKLKENQLTKLRKIMWKSVLKTKKILPDLEPRVNLLRRRWNSWCFWDLNATMTWALNQRFVALAAVKRGLKMTEFRFIQPLGEFFSLKINFLYTLIKNNTGIHNFRKELFIIASCFSAKSRQGKEAREGKWW